MYVLHKPWDDTQLPVRKFDTYLPFVPSLKDTLYFISTIPDIKQKAMAAVMYSSGLRIGEVCHLRYEDIDRTNMRVHVTHGKNREDRYAVLSKNALDILTQYWFECGRPRGWLFPKQTDPERPINTFFLSRHIHEHEDRLGWPRRITCHSFRHALGTHLYENGTDLLTIKALLGHKSLNSTTIYVHLATNSLHAVKNPFDRIGGVVCMTESKIQQIFRFGWDAYKASFQPDDMQEKAARSIIDCKTEKCGYNISTCQD